MPAWWVSRVKVLSGGESNETSPIGAIVTEYEPSDSSDEPGSLWPARSEQPASSPPPTTVPPYFM